MRSLELKINSPLTLSKSRSATGIISEKPAFVMGCAIASQVQGKFHCICRPQHWAVISRTLLVLHRVEMTVCLVIARMLLHPVEMSLARPIAYTRIKDCILY